jgi:hypothetical protein
MDQETDRRFEIGSSPDAPATGDTGVTPEKIGGWLFLPAAGLILGGILSMVGLIMLLGAASGIPSRYQGIFAVNLLFDAGLTAFLIYAAVRFFGKKRNAPAIMIALMIAGIALNGVLVAVNIGAGAEPLAINCAKAMGRGIIGAIIWIPYFLVSKRVKRTFVMP